MAIELDIKDYCCDCCDFVPDVTNPERVTLADIWNNEILSRQTNTIVRCAHANRCEAIRRYLTRQMNTNGVG